MDTSRRARGAAGLLSLAALALAGCAAEGGRAVAACPDCGDPVTVTGPDGRLHVLTRLRLRGMSGPPDIALGLGPWTLSRGPAEPAAPR